MDCLIPEMIQEIAKSLGICSYHSLRMVSRRYRAVLPAKEMCADSVRDDQTLHLSASNDSLRSDEKQSIRSTKATLHDPLPHYLRCLLNYNPLGTMIYWTTKGYLDNMKFFVTLTKGGKRRNCREIHFSLDASVFRSAVEVGNLEIMKWLVDQRCKIPADIFYSAAKQGNIENMLWLRSIGVQWGSAHLGAKENLDILKWLIMQKCPVKDPVSEKILKSTFGSYGNLTVLRWQLLHDAPTSGFCSGGDGYLHLAKARDGEKPISYQALASLVPAKYMLKSDRFEEYWKAS